MADELFDLNAFDGGKLRETFDHAVGRVLANIQDLNTPDTGKRKLTLEFTFIPDKNRNMVDIEYQEKLQLCGWEKCKVPGHVARSRNGELQLVELLFPGQNPEQHTLMSDKVTKFKPRAQEEDNGTDG